LAAENLYLRKQLALFQERKVKAHRAHDSTRLIMVILGRMFWWRDALVNVQPDTFLRWHRQGFRLLWRWKSRPAGRPRLPQDLRRLIREMAAENPTWGEERIANELQLKLTIRVSPRTVGKLPSQGQASAPTGPKTALADLRPQPCQGHGGLRLLRGDHLWIPKTPSGLKMQVLAPFVRSSWFPR
jgi:hypothetical protein